MNVFQNVKMMKLLSNDEFYEGSNSVCLAIF